MSITLSDNINLPAPKPLRTTELVGFGAPASEYSNKEAIPEWHRHLFMETIEPSGQKWILKNPLDIMEWTPVPPIIPGPTSDGSFVRTKLQNYEDWAPLPAIIPEPTADGDWVRRVTGGIGVWALNSGGGGGGTWGSITGTLSDQTDLQLALDNKANTDGNPMARFEVADGVGNNDAVSLQQLDAKVQTDVPAGAVFDNTQIDPQEGHGIVIDKTDPMAPIFSTELTVIDVTYEELRGLKDTLSLIPGQHYMITDFKTHWHMDDGQFNDGTYSGSDDGLAYNFDTAVEPLYVHALTKNQINHVVKSDTYPDHVIYYDAKWDWNEYGDLIRAIVVDPVDESGWEIVKKEDLEAGWNYKGDFDAAIDVVPITAAIDDYWEVTGQGAFFTKTVKRDAPEQPKGAIYFRKDLEISLEAGFDYVGYRVTRWAVTAPEYVAATPYGKQETCSMPDPAFPADRSKDALFISLQAGNTGNDPVATDGEWWALFRPAGEDTTGMYRDYVASDWTDRDGYPQVDMSLTRTFGFQVVKNRFQNFPTFAFSHDLTIVDGKGPDPQERFLWSKVENQGNLLMGTGNTAYYENYFINLDGTVYGTTFIGQFLYQITMKSMYGGTMKNYVFGSSWDINISSSSAWFQDNYFEGFSFIEGISVSSISAEMSHNISIRKGASRDAHTGRSINGTTFTCSNTIFYMSNWIHANGEIHIVNSTVLAGAMSYNRGIWLKDSLVKPGANIQYSSIMSRNTHGYNENVVLNSIIRRTVLDDLQDVTIDGNLHDVTGHNWHGVTIPANVSFTDTLFAIPRWYGKNVWSGTPLAVKGVVISKKYIDDPAVPTLEKLWYSKPDATGAVTDIEIT